MKAVEIAGFGGPEVLRLCERPLPELDADEVLIKVEAAGVNRPDVMQRLGLYPPPPGASDIPGLEVSGKIVGLGDSVSGWALGDAVCALVTGGGYAGYCKASAPLCLPIPCGLDFVQAAALPETFFTVWSNVFERGRLKPGESFLVHGGSSGIGTTAIQLARAFHAKVYATCGSPLKCKACEKLGAVAINYRQTDFVDFIKTQTDGMDVILDMVGGDYLQRNLSCLKLEGRLLQIGLQNGSKTTVNLAPILLKRLTLSGSTLRSRSVEEKACIASSLKSKVWPLLESGEVKPLIDRVFPLHEAASAHRLMESGQHIGKIVLSMADD